jgi:azobenzene reductase
MTPRPRILLLGGSLARPSHTASLLRAFERVLAVRGAATCRWDIAQRPLTPVQPGLQIDTVDLDRRAFLQAAEAADALVIASPLYHGSYSGVVKDALDHLTPKHVAGKPVALLSSSGGAVGAHALDHLRAVVRALHAVAIPRQVVTVDSDYVLDDDRYRLQNADTRVRLDELGTELLWFTERLRGDAHAGVTGGPVPAAPVQKRSRRALAASTRRV